MLEISERKGKSKWLEESLWRYPNTSFGVTVMRNIQVLAGQENPDHQTFKFIEPSTIYSKKDRMILVRGALASPAPKPWLPRAAELLREHSQRKQIRRPEQQRKNSTTGVRRSPVKSQRK